MQHSRDLARGVPLHAGVNSDARRVPRNGLRALPGIEAPRNHERQFEVELLKQHAIRTPRKTARRVASLGARASTRNAIGPPRRSRARASRSAAVSTGDAFHDAASECLLDVRIRATVSLAVQWQDIRASAPRRWLAIMSSSVHRPVSALLPRGPWPACRARARFKAQRRGSGKNTSPTCPGRHPARRYVSAYSRKF